MYINNSDIRFDKRNSHRNINTMFRATSTAEYKKIIIAILCSSLTIYAERPTDGQTSEVINLPLAKTAGISQVVAQLLRYSQHNLNIGVQC